MTIEKYTKIEKIECIIFIFHIPKNIRTRFLKQDFSEHYY